jgi:aminoglycoside phosphotransferase (APT) family kinase protein
VTAAGVIASHPRHNWLAALVPADARRFRVADADLADTLAHAGAELTETSPDVEIVLRADGLKGDAPYAIVSLGLIQSEGGARTIRAAKKIAASLRVRAQAERSRRALRRHDYPTTTVILWEWTKAMRLPWLEPRSELAWSERFPLNALVVGSRRGRPETVLDSSLAQAGEQTGASLEPDWPLATQTGLVAIDHLSVLRLAIGPAWRQLGRQRDVLATLGAASLTPSVARRVPSLLGHGRTGLAEWSLEERLPGAAPPPRLSDGLLDECVDFLLALHEAGNNSEPTSFPAKDAEILARASESECADLVRRIGNHVESALVDVPRVFAHGDFWSHNLLVENGRLVGVIDWDNGGPGRLPLLDLLHLRVNAVRAATHQFLGPAVVEYLLPWARAGGDELVRNYARRIGIEPTTAQLEAFAVAYWLDRIGHELESHADRVDRPVWMEQNVELVVRAIAEAGLVERRIAAPHP